MLADSKVSAIGTANFDNRSFRLNFEVTALVADEGFAAQVEQMLIDDLDRSTFFDPATLEELPFHRRLAIRIFRLMAPIHIGAGSVVSDFSGWQLGQTISLLLSGIMGRNVQL